MGEVDNLIKTLDADSRRYMEECFASAPGSLMDAFRIERMPKNQIFIHEGQKADTIYILLTGKVLAIDYRVEGLAYGFQDFYPVKIFGAMEILAHMDEYKTTLITVTDSIFLITSMEKFETWLRGDPGAFMWLTEKIMNFLLEEARKERLYVLFQSEDRICLILYNMYQLYEKDGVCRLCMSRRELSETVGVSERTVTRILGAMREKGLISKDGRNIVITREQYRAIKAVIENKICEAG